MEHLRSSTLGALAVLFTLGALAACGGGGGSGYGGGGNPPPGGATPPHSTQQVVLIALPTSAMGYYKSGFGTIGGYTQTATSQVLGFSPGQQVMFMNAQTPGQNAPPHTLGDTGAPSFIPNPPLSTTGSGGNTFAAHYQSGTIAPGQSIGPVTLTTGTYYIGCAYHYTSLGMRDVLIVAPNAQPGPEGTPPPGQTPPPPGGGGGYGY
jgi:plastocyanin